MSVVDEGPGGAEAPVESELEVQIAELRRRREAGDLKKRALKQAAALCHRAAREIVGDDPDLDPEETLGDRVERLVRICKTARWRVALACIRLALDKSLAGRDVPELEARLKALQDWVREPNEARREAFDLTTRAARQAQIDFLQAGSASKAATARLLATIDLPNDAELAASKIRGAKARAEAEREAAGGRDPGRSRALPQGKAIGEALEGILGADLWLLDRRLATEVAPFVLGLGDPLDGGAPEIPDPRAPKPYSIRERFKVGQRLAHKTFGLGTVRGVRGPSITVEFEDGSSKTLVHDRN